MTDERGRDTWEVPTGLFEIDAELPRVGPLKLIDAFIPARLRVRSAEALTRARFLVILCLGSAFFAVSHLPFNMTSVGMPTAALIVAFAVAMMVNPLVLRRTGALREVSLLLTAEMFVALLAAALLVGPTAFYTVLPWNFTVPVVGILLVGLRVGSFFGLLCVIEHAAFYWLLLSQDQLRWFADTAKPVPTPGEVFASAALILWATVLGAVFERARSVSQREQDRLQLALQESRQRYKLVVKGSYDGVWDWDLRRNEAFFSRAFCTALGVAAPELGGDPEAWLCRIHPEDQQRVRDALRACMDGDSDRVDCEHRILQADGTYRWFLLRGVPLFSRSGQAVRIAGSMSDITARKAYESQLLHAAAHDPLTGLPNRAVFLETLKRSVARDGRSGHPYAVLFVDLDGFKQINDEHGHGVGDRVLQTVGERLRQSMRETSMVARLGGDEFAVHVDDLSEAQDLTLIATRIIHALGMPIDVDRHRFVLRVSIGIATTLKRPYEGPREVLQGADTAMYVAKRAGGSRFAFDGSSEPEPGGIVPLWNDEGADRWSAGAPWS